MTNPAAEVRVFAPATVSNVGPGFDAFGFALAAPGDIVRVRRAAAPGVRIVALDGGDGAIPLEAERNTAGVAAARVWAAAGGDDGIELHVEKGLPGGTGLGSSAASAVAAAVATMHLAVRDGAAWDDALVFDAALDGEAVASGARHADNVAPALYGGFTVVRPGNPPAVARFVPALPCRVAVVTPRISISTKETRAALPVHVPLAGAVRNWANAASLVLGLVTADRALVARSLEDDLVEPHRIRLVPGAGAARRAAFEAGAFACGLSGSGPTMFALADDDAGAAAVAAAMAGAFTAAGLPSRTGTSPIAAEGARKT